MLALLLAIAVAIAALGLFLAAVLLPPLTRRSDLLWSGVAGLYALILWNAHSQFRGALLLSQIAAIALLGWLGQQAMQSRWLALSPEQQAAWQQGTLWQQSWQRLQKLDWKAVWSTPSAAETSTSAKPSLLGGLQSRLRGRKTHGKKFVRPEEAATAAPAPTLEEAAEAVLEPVVTETVEAVDAVVEQAEAIAEATTEAVTEAVSPIAEAVTEAIETVEAEAEPAIAAVTEAAEPVVEAVVESAAAVEETVATVSEAVETVAEPAIAETADVVEAVTDTVAAVVAEAVDQVTEVAAEVAEPEVSAAVEETAVVREPEPEVVAEFPEAEPEAVVAAETPVQPEFEPVEAVVEANQTEAIAETVAEVAIAPETAAVPESEPVPEVVTEAEPEAIVVVEASLAADAGGEAVAIVVEPEPVSAPVELQPVIISSLDELRNPDPDLAQRLGLS